VAYVTEKALLNKPLCMKDIEKKNYKREGWREERKKKNKMNQLDKGKINKTS
jgi:hypothetical protein